MVPHRAGILAQIMGQKGLFLSISFGIKTALKVTLKAGLFSAIAISKNGISGGGWFWRGFRSLREIYPLGFAEQNPALISNVPY